MDERLIMQTGRPSKTAAAMAHIRAKYSKLHPEILADPLAERILCAPVLDETVLDRGLATDVAERRGLYVLARSRFADDGITAAIAKGADQVVILGAGLDTTAYRGTHDARFFEVDHPDTQHWKRQLLAEAAITIPDSLTFVPIDFEQATLASELAKAGLDRTRPAVYIALGVTPYLSRPALDDMLRYITAHDGGEAVLDYFYPPDEATADQLQTRAESAARLGEPWLSCFVADEFHDILRSYGCHIEDHSASDLVATYGARRKGRATAAGPHVVHLRKRTDLLQN
ncbi:class I SAM-dependent methyltransferase [Nocardia nova]|uniref:class I SAM-dependent methyltransferase n=1 Tax=Nocardia nova TaxID=37330 RepID=UPI0007A3C4C9|nr:SAM-dependent methyltransferase [Nocardia nova]